jgi:dTDP-4-dehydrorhamnose 3,5-epimerase
MGGAVSGADSRAPGDRVRFTPAPLEGAWIVDQERHQDMRGYFARTWCRREFTAHGLNPELVQCSVSFNVCRGTLRGMHWQASPHQEVKLVRCTRGSIWDVIVDLRPGSRSYLRHFGLELRADTGTGLYVPEGFAHGFVTLEDATEVFYQMSAFHEPAASRGARWNDPAFGIAWPVKEPILHPRDAGYADFTGGEP